MLHILQKQPVICIHPKRYVDGYVSEFYNFGVMNKSVEILFVLNNFEIEIMLSL